MKEELLLNQVETTQIAEDLIPTPEDSQSPVVEQSALPEEEPVAVSEVPLNEVQPQPTSLYESQRGKDNFDMLNNVSTAVGVDSSYMIAIGGVESNHNVNAKSSTSSASGQFQLLDTTFKEQLKKHGAEYGIPMDADKNDPVVNATLAAAYMKDNIGDFSQRFNRKATMTDAYLGHFLGNGGRAKFVRGMDNDPDVDATTLVSDNVAQANRGVFFNRDGSPKTAREVYRDFTNKLDNHQVVPKNRRKVSSPEVANGAKSSLDNSPEFGNNVAERTPSSDIGLNGEASDALDGLRQVGTGSGDAVDTSVIQPEALPTTPLGEQPEEPKTSYETVEEKGYWDDLADVVVATADNSPVMDWVNDKTGFNYKGTEALSHEENLILSAYNLDEDFKTNGNIWDGNIDWNQAEPLLEQLKFTDQEREILKQKAYYPQQLEGAITRVLTMRENNEIKEGANLGTGAVAEGLSIGLDPINYFTAGATSLGGKIAENVGTNVISEFFNSERTGAEARYGQAIVGAAGITLGMHGLSKGLTGASIRLKSRSESLATDSKLDASLIPQVVIKDHFKQYPDTIAAIPHPTEKGAVITRDGVTVSSFNPMNPIIRKDLAEQDTHIPMGGFTELGIDAHGALSPEIKAAAGMTVRSPVGLKGGGSGADTMTMEDIIQKTTQTDNSFANSLQIKLAKARMSGKNVLDGSNMERRIVEAIESGDNSLLSKQEIDVVNHVRQHFVDKENLMKNPSHFGNPNAKPIMETKGIDSGRYFPVQNDDGLVNDFINRVGGDDAAIKRITDNFESQWKSNHNDIQTKFRDRYADEIGELEDEAVEKMAMEYIQKKAYGMINRGKDNMSAAMSRIVDSGEDSLVGTRTDFLKERHMFDTGYKTGSDMFSLNDLRNYNLQDVSFGYNRAVNGDLAIHGATGMDKETWGQHLSDLNGKANTEADKRALNALNEMGKLASGYSRRSSEKGALEFYGEALLNGGFIAKNALMWTNNLVEAAGVMNYHALDVGRNGIPALKRILNPTAKWQGNDVKFIKQAVFGEDINRVLEGNFKQSYDYLRDQGYGKVNSAVAAGLQRGTKAVAHYNPYTQLLNQTQKILTDRTRGIVLGQIADDVLNGKHTFTDEFLNYADISKENYKALTDMIKEHTSIVDGKLQLNNQEAFKLDPRVNHLWRLADKAATETTQRSGRIGQAYRVKPNGLLGFFTQFKSFSIGGLNGTFMKFVNQGKNGRAVDMAMATVASMAAAQFVYGLQTQYKAIGVPDEHRQAYLDKMLDDDHIIASTLSRGRVMGAPMFFIGGAASMFPEDTAVGKIGSTISGMKTSGSGKPEDVVKDVSKGYEEKKNLGEALIDYTPSAGFAGNLVAFGKNAAERSKMELTGNTGGAHEAEVENQLMQALGQLLPNDPLVSKLLNSLREDMGASDTKLQQPWMN